MSIPTRLCDAPQHVARLAEQLADTLVDSVVGTFAAHIRSFDLDDPGWRDLVVGTFEWAVEKVTEAAAESEVKDD